MPELALWNWSKGWHPEKPEALLEDGELAEAVNVMYRDSLYPEKRRGFTRLIATALGAGRIDGLTRYNDKWIAACGGKLYAITDAGAVTQIASGLASGVDYRFAVWRDLLFIVNGVDGLYMWDGTTLTNLSTTEPPAPPQPSGFPMKCTVSAATSTTITDNTRDFSAAGVVPGDRVKITSGAGAGQERTVSSVSGSTITVSSAWATVPAVGGTFEVWAEALQATGTKPVSGAAFIAQHADRLWIASTASQPDTVWYSRLLDYSSWNDPETGIDNLIDVSVGDNQKLTGIIPARDSLLIFKERSIYILRGYLPEEWVLDRITDDLGCIAPKSIAKLDSTVIWLSHRGVYMDDGASFRRIGGPVDRWIKDNLTLDQQAQAVGIIAGVHYLLHFPQSPFGPVVLVWNGRLDNWVQWTLPFSLSALAAKSGTDEWVAGSTTGLIYLGDSGGSDDGTAISARVQSRELNPTEMQTEYLVRRIASAIDVELDDEAKVEIISAGVPIGGTHAVEDGTYFVSVPRGTLVRRLAVAVRIDGKGVGSRIRGVTLDVRPRRVRWS